jgi:class 3 adenylate cyclase
VAPERSSPTDQRDRERNRVSRLLKPHAPPDWERRFRATELLDAVIDGEPIQMFVMAADIRESTTLMKESVKFERFAAIMDKFVSSVRLGIRRSGGWFDRFTGDGFLAYWIVQSGAPDEYEERFVQTAGDIAHTANILIDLFHRRVLEDFRSNSRNLSSGVGLSMGLDAGPGYLVKIADELTIVGPPVVGSVRMVTAAALPKEIVANVFLGERLREGQDGVYEALGVRVNREFRPTKEYPRGQEVYALTFEQDGSELETPNEDADEEAPRDVVDAPDATGAGDGKVA